jgi:hypothetical protein
MDDVLQQVRDERQRLRRQREAIDARLAELDVVLRVLPTLGVRPSPLAAIVEMATTVDASNAEVTTIKETILRQCQRLLADGKPRHTRELVAHLTSNGVQLNGKDQVLQVSAILSKDDRFKADRKNGWSLVDVPQQAEGPGAPTPEPSSSRQLPLSTAVPPQPQP